MFLDFLDGWTRMVLINAVYFKGLWKIPFNSDLTEDKDFWITPKQKVKTPMMTTEDEFKYCQCVTYLDASALTLDYKVSIHITIFASFIYFWLF